MHSIKHPDMSTCKSAVHGVARRNILAGVIAVSSLFAISQAAVANTSATDLFGLLPQSRDTSLGAINTMYGKANPDSAAYDKEKKLETQAPDADATTIGGNPHGGEQNLKKVSVDMPQGPTLSQQEAKPPTSAKNQPPQQIDWIYYTEPFRADDGPPPIKHPIYHHQPFYFNPVGKQLGSAADANTAFVQTANTKGIRVTDSSYQMQRMTGMLRRAHLNNAPERKVAAAQAAQQGKTRGASEAAADGAESTTAASMMEAMLGLINVANENAAVPVSGQPATKILPQAIWMVQQMFHQCYIPMAILLLLPGAMMTQMKAMVQYGMLSATDEDAEGSETGPSPFVAIFRCIIAIFLIPATQLIVSWMVDIGNSMTYEIEKYLVPSEVFNWAKEQTYNPPTANDENQLLPKKGDDPQNDPSGDSTEGDSGTGVQIGDAGIALNGPEAHSSVRDQQLMTQSLQAGFNMAAFSLAAAFGVLLAFQTVMMCYLFLLGPIAAALYAWPSGIGSLFKKVFINWVDAVINLSLWRFWWAVVVLIMYTRIEWLKSIGEYQPNNQWEMLMYAAFMVIIVYVPFMPFEFKPGDMVDKILEKAEQGQQGGGGSGGAGSSSGGASSAGSASRGGATAGSSMKQSSPVTSAARKGSGPAAPAAPPSPPPSQSGRIMTASADTGGQSTPHIPAPPPFVTT